MATNIYDDMTGQVDSYVAISKRAAAGQPVIGNDSTGPLVQVSFLKRPGKNVGGQW